MVETISHKFNDKWVLMQRWIRVFIAAIVVSGLSACEDDTDEPMPEPSASTFKLHIGEGNIIKMDLETPDCYPDMYSVVLVMEDLPADEKIIYIGGVYSTENTGTNGETFWSDNIMDYGYGFMTGLTPEQYKRISHTHRYAYSRYHSIMNLY